MIRITHNPDCETSRNALAMVRQSGEAHEVIEYLKNPPAREQLVAWLRAMNLPARALLREKGTPYHALGLDDLALPEDALLDAMLAHPILINRPIVESAKGVKLCRPSELVLALLENPQIGPFTKEDGGVVIDADGMRAR